MTESISTKTAQSAADKLKIGATERHIFLCTGKADSKGCCSAETGDLAWTQLKEACAAHGKSESSAVIQRTAVKCLRICAEGPVAVVYPEGVWYRGCSGENLRRIFDEHMVNGRPVAELQIELTKSSP